MSKIIYSCHPIRKFSIGSFDFTEGQLIFTDGIANEDPNQKLEDFEQLHSTLPAQQRMVIKRMDQGLADRIAKQFLEQQSQIVRGAHSTLSEAEKANNALREANRINMQNGEHLDSDTLTNEIEAADDGTLVVDMNTLKGASDHGGAPDPNVDPGLSNQVKEGSPQPQPELNAGPNPVIEPQPQPDSEKGLEVDPAAPKPEDAAAVTQNGVDPTTASQSDPVPDADAAPVNADADINGADKKPNPLAGLKLGKPGVA